MPHSEREAWRELVDRLPPPLPPDLPPLPPPKSDTNLLFARPPLLSAARVRRQRQGDPS